MADVYTQLFFQPSPDYLTALAKLEECKGKGPAHVGQGMKFEREVIFTGIMTRTLHEAGLTKLAVDWADKIVALTKDPYFEYCSLGVALNCLKSAIYVHVKQHMWDLFEHDMR